MIKRNPFKRASYNNYNSHINSCLIDVTLHVYLIPKSILNSEAIIEALHAIHATC